MCDLHRFHPTPWRDPYYSPFDVDIPPPSITTDITDGDDESFTSLSFPFLILFLFLICLVLFLVYAGFQTWGRNHTSSIHSCGHKKKRGQSCPSKPPSEEPPTLPCNATEEQKTAFTKAYGYPPFGSMVTCPTGPRGPPGCPFEFHSTGLVNDAFFTITFNNLGCCLLLPTQDVPM